MEIVRERLGREFNLTLMATAPSVEYRADETDGTTVQVHHLFEMPPPRSWSASRSHSSRCHGRAAGGVHRHGHG